MDDLHFLDRLRRVTPVQMDMALGLYRDPELVRFVLDEVRAPPECDRIAIALADSPTPPYAIVARDGGFVTCLGEGMDPGHAWRLPRGALERLAQKHERLQFASHYAKALLADRRSFQRLWQELLTGGHRVPREVIVALLPVANLLVTLIVEQLMVQGDRARSLLVHEGGRLIARQHKLGARETDALMRLWQSQWAMGHLFVLLGAAEQDRLRVISERDDLLDTLVFLGQRDGFGPTALRASWFAARAPAPSLRVFARALEKTADSYPGGPARVMSLGFVGASQSRARDAALGILSRWADLANPTSAPRLPNGAPLALPLTENLTDTALWASRFVAAFAGGRVDDRRGTSAAFFGWYQRAVGDVPHDQVMDEAALRECVRDPEGTAVARLGRLWWVNASGCVWRHQRYRDDLPGLIGWLARAAPENLYPDDSQREQITPPFTTELVYPWLAHMNGVYTGLGREPVQRDTPKVGRNDPCGCGSGKKHKKCCGA